MRGISEGTQTSGDTALDVLYHGKDFRSALLTNAVANLGGEAIGGIARGVLNNRVLLLNRLDPRNYQFRQNGHFIAGMGGTGFNGLPEYISPNKARIDALLEQLGLDRRLARDVERFLYQAGNPRDLLLGLEQSKLVKWADDELEAGREFFHTIGKFTFPGFLKGIPWNKQIVLAMERVDAIRWRKTKDLDVYNMSPDWFGNPGEYSPFELFTLFANEHLMEKLVPGFNPFKR